MATINVEVRPHPAQARCPKTGEPLWNEDGTPVPLISRSVQQSIWMNGRMVGYCGGTASEPMSFIVPRTVLPETVREVVVEKVTTILGGDWHDAKKVTQVRIPEEKKLGDADD